MRLLWPLGIGLLLLILLPLLGSLLLSLFQYDALSSPRFVGLNHYQALFEDARFKQALYNSLLIASLAVPVRILLAVAMASLLQGRGRIKRSGLLLSFSPMVIPEIAWATAWLWILNPHFGPAAWAMNWWQPHSASWLLSLEGARASLVFVLSFLIGEMILILVLVRRQIPRLYYETATLEGLGGLRQFWWISLPILFPVILLLAARDFAMIFQASFVPAQIVTKGGPMFGTTMLPQYVFENAFEYLRFGYAAALNNSMVLITALLLIAQIALLWDWFRSKDST